MVKASQVLEYVESHLADISAEEIGRCHKVFGSHGSFYLVENEAGECNEHGVIEYAVNYSAEHGFTCTCPSGMYGFANVNHASGVCKHVRWALAATIEEATALAAIAKKIEAERKAALPIEERWGIPKWIMDAAHSPRAKYSPKELD